MPLTQPDAPVTLVSRFNRVLAALFWIVCGAAALGLVVTSGTRSYLDVVPLVVYIGVSAYFVLWRPSLTVDADGVHIENVTRRIDVPWNALVHIDTKYALTVHVPGRAFAVWCAPAPGATGALRASRDHRAQARGTVEADIVRPGDLPATESGRAAGIIRERWHALRDSGALDAGSAHETPTTTTWNIPALAVLSVGAILAILSIALF
ncbi:PH domain-containing protein [Agromyces atrinae]|uniref:PH domain-containing protein n=1 Tax=Agromyces atrinae TaxID=592376 RepID=UPI001F580723|nr:PH domain-containing protein [Agromyces atrinae]MCI2959254.1 PH domain-containing protein [Agromyces atrinae]